MSRERKRLEERKQRWSNDSTKTIKCRVTRENHFNRFYLQAAVSHLHSIYARRVTPGNTRNIHLSKAHLRQFITASKMRNRNVAIASFSAFCRFSRASIETEKFSPVGIKDTKFTVVKCISKSSSMLRHPNLLCSSPSRHWSPNEKSRKSRKRVFPIALSITIEWQKRLFSRASRRAFQADSPQSYGNSTS